MGPLLRIVIVDFETFAHYGAYLLYVKKVLTGTRHKQVKVKLASFEFSIVLFTDSHIQVEYTKRGADFSRDAIHGLRPLG